MRLRCMGAGVYDHGYALAYERLTDHAPQRTARATGCGGSAPSRSSPRQVRSSGRCPLPATILPGVMLASAVRDYVVNYGVSLGDRTVVVTNNDDAYRTAIVLKEAGLEVPVIVDARPEAEGPLIDQRPRLGHPRRDGQRHCEGQGRQARDRRGALCAGRRRGRA